jgi:hypothetical protein
MKTTIALLASLLVIGTAAQAQDNSTAARTKLVDVGLLAGYGAGTNSFNGFTWGATAGAKATENWGWDVYFSSTKKDAGLGLDVTMMPIMADFNFYVAAPIQFYVGPRAGVMITRYSAAGGSTSNSDFAAGAQIGTDFWLAESITAGVNVNWNHAFSDPSSVDLWNFVVPVKFWF